MRARVRGRSRADQFQKEASSPGLAPEDNLMIVEKCAAERSSEGRLRSNGEADRRARVRWTAKLPLVEREHGCPVREHTLPTATPAHTANSQDHRTEAKNHQRPAIDSYSSTEERTTRQQNSPAH